MTETNKEKMKAVNIHLDRSTNEMLEVLMKHFGASKSWVLRHAAKKLFESIEN